MASCKHALYAQSPRTPQTYNWNIFWNALQWRFTVAYVMMAAVCTIFGAAQKLGFGPAPVQSEDSTMHFQEDWYDVSDVAKVNHTNTEPNPTDVPVGQKLPDNVSDNGSMVRIVAYYILVHIRMVHITRVFRLGLLGFFSAPAGYREKEHNTAGVLCCYCLHSMYVYMLFYYLSFGCCFCHPCTRYHVQT
jgi:hypothetical protein